MYMADNWDSHQQADLVERRRVADYTTAVELKGINSTLAEITTTPAFSF